MISYLNLIIFQIICFTLFFCLVFKLFNYVYIYRILISNLKKPRLSTIILGTH